MVRFEEEDVLIVGESGQLAQALKEKLPRARFLGRTQLDIQNPEEVASVLGREKPRLVINAAAHTAVDAAEKDAEKERVLKMNHFSVIKMAEWCQRENAAFIHFSTDYVFAPSSAQLLKEESPRGALNWYGETKLQAERALEKLISDSADFRCFVFRVSWVYSHIGSNFVRTMLRLGKEKEVISVVSDQVGFPTYAPDIAEWISKAFFLSAGQPFPPSGIYNLSGTEKIQDFCSWYDLAVEVFQLARQLQMSLNVKEVKPLKTSEYPTPALRPLNSRMSDQKVLQHFGFGLPERKQSLLKCLEKIRSLENLPIN